MAALLRTFGNAVPNSGDQLCDVTDPAKPKKTSSVVTGLHIVRLTGEAANQLAGETFRPVSGSATREGPERSTGADPRRRA
jgi:hypothetical protein